MEIRFSQSTPRLSGAPRRFTSRNSGPVDTVSLSRRPTADLKPKAYLQRASSEFLKLIPTHPQEQDEFMSGATEVREMVSEILYGGEWPDDEVSLPPHQQPGSPATNGGLTRSEQLISNDLIQIYRITSPHVREPEQHKRLASAIHSCQSGLQSRVLRRDYPNYWMSTPGSLERDADREKERWGSSLG